MKKYYLNNQETASSMIETARHLRETVNNALPRLRAINDKRAGVRPMQGKWSKKEILGHLIDSAGNNQQKFVRLMEAPILEFVRYDQDYWVNSQNYNHADWQQLISLWEAFNLHLAHVMEYTPQSKLQHQIIISGVGPFTLEFIMKDYVEHLKHHLKAIIPDAGIDSKFENIYNQ